MSQYQSIAWNTVQPVPAGSGAWIYGNWTIRRERPGLWSAAHGGDHKIPPLFAGSDRALLWLIRSWEHYLATGDITRLHPAPIREADPERPRRGRPPKQQEKLAPQVEQQPEPQVEQSREKIPPRPIVLEGVRSAGPISERAAAVLMRRRIGQLLAK